MRNVENVHATFMIYFSITLGQVWGGSYKY